MVLALKYQHTVALPLLVFSGTSPATGHSHELENQLQLV